MKEDNGMSVFNNKKSGKSGGNVIETYGKTEPVAGNPFGVTEPISTANAVNLGEIPVTVPATSGVIDVTNLISGGVQKPVIDDYEHTVPAGPVQVVHGGEKLQPVVGWLVCIKGANVGKEYRIHSDYNYVGSATGDIVISGDGKISREKHMMITYDPKTRNFYVAPASGANIVYLNGEGLYGGAGKLKNYDEISTGDTTLKFIAFCGENFGWEDIENG